MLSQHLKSSMRWLQEEAARPPLVTTADRGAMLDLHHGEASAGFEPPALTVRLGEKEKGKGLCVSFIHSLRSLKWSNYYP